MDAIDVIKATFPAGTVSGAPKVRAMEIIDELEPSKRGIYAGAVGYLGFNGDMDVAIAIRTGVIKNNMLYVQAGAGIVADSQPDAELAETEKNEMAILQKFLPAALSAEEIEALLDQAIATTGATSKADMGRTMKVLQELVNGRADGRALSEAVMKRLS
jgi:NH3-dependent NAD+ synthetase